MKKILNFIYLGVGGLLAATAFMFFVAWVDPTRSGINLETFFKCLISVSGTLLFFWYNNKKCNRDQLAAMRNDGLADNDIKEIVGEELYTKMLNS